MESRMLERVSKPTGLEVGNHFLHEHPSPSGSWDMPEIKELEAKKEQILAKAKPCAEHCDEVELLQQKLAHLQGISALPSTLQSIQRRLDEAKKA